MSPSTLREYIPKTIVSTVSADTARGRAHLEEARDPVAIDPADRDPERPMRELCGRRLPSFCSSSAAARSQRYLGLGGNPVDCQVRRNMDHNWRSGTVINQRILDSGLMFPKLHAQRAASCGHKPNMSRTSSQLIVRNGCKCPPTSGMKKPQSLTRKLPKEVTPRHDIACDTKDRTKLGLWYPSSSSDEFFNLWAST